MSVISGFTMSPPASISGIESVISDTESTHSTGNKGNPATATPFGDAVSKYVDSNQRLVYEVPKLQEGFSFEDGDTCILAGNTLLATHSYLLKRFKTLGDRINDRILVLRPEDHDIEDFRNTFKIIYASVIDETCKFDIPTLTSALRLSTAYEYPALRTFAIKRLEDATLSAIDRIRLAREFNLASWEEPAYVELCERDEAITTSEASVLGLNAFVHVAKIREQEQRRRGRDIDAVVESEDAESANGESQVTGDHPKDGDSLPSALAGSHFSDVAGKKAQKRMRMRKARSAAVVLPLTTKNVVEEPQANQDKETGTKADEKKTIEVSMKPCFIDASIPDVHDIDLRGSHNGVIELPVAGCTCTTGPGYPPGSSYFLPNGIACVCKLPACAVSAFKNLQIQQVAHANNIARLETVVAQLQIPPTPPTLEDSTGPVSSQPVASTPIQEEVRKWLNRCRDQVERG